MYCISISHKRAKVNIREKFAFTKEEVNSFTKLLEAVTNLVILSTCNRLEIYFDKPEVNSVINALCNFKNINQQEIADYIDIFNDEGVIRHLCKVTSGVESLIIGEDEILAQVKHAYYYCNSIKDVGTKLHILFEGAICCAKRVKTSTRLSNTPISIGTLVANKIIDNNIKNIMIIGIRGTVGKIIFKNLSKYNLNIIGTTRNHGIYENKEYTGVKFIPYANRYEYLDWADCIISATTSPHYTITYNRANNLKGNKVFIDLAVPKDIDDKISSIAKVYNIDYFNTIADNNNNIRISEIKDANIIIKEEVDVICKKLYFKAIYKKLDTIKHNMNKLSSDKLIYTLRDNLSYSEFKRLIELFME